MVIASFGHMSRQLPQPVHFSQSLRCSPRYRWAGSFGSNGYRNVFGFLKRYLIALNGLKIFGLPMHDLLSVYLRSNDVQADHDVAHVSDARILEQLFEDDKSVCIRWGSKVYPVRLSATIAYQVKAQFAP